MTTSAANRFSSRKLLLTKWTAVSPVSREKHFLVTNIGPPEQPEAPVEWAELEAVLTGRKFILPWRELKDASHWLPGWL